MAETQAGREIYSGYPVCSLHFEPWGYISFSNKKEQTINPDNQPTNHKWTLDPQLFARLACGPGAGQGGLSGLVGAAHRTLLPFGSPWPMQPGWRGQWGQVGRPRSPQSVRDGCTCFIPAHQAGSLRPCHCTLNSIRNLTNLINPPSLSRVNLQSGASLALIHLRLNDLPSLARE